MGVRGKWKGGITCEKRQAFSWHDNQILFIKPYFYNAWIQVEYKLELKGLKAIKIFIKFLLFQYINHSWDFSSTDLSDEQWDEVEKAWAEPEQD